MIKNIDKLMKDAQKNIVHLNAEMKKLEKENKQFRKEFHTEFNKAKKALREVRQKLRKLAHKTIVETLGLEILLKSIDKNKN